MCDIAKAVLGLKSVALTICIRKGNRSEIHDLSFHLKKLKKKEQIKVKVSRKKKIIKTREEINETENRKEEKH